MAKGGNGLQFAILEWKGIFRLVSFRYYMLLEAFFFLTRFLFLKVIDFELPITVKLVVVDADPGLRGDTAQGILCLF